MTEEHTNYVILLDISQFLPSLKHLHLKSCLRNINCWISQIKTKLRTLPILISNSLIHGECFLQKPHQSMFLAAQNQRLKSLLFHSTAC